MGLRVLGTGDFIGTVELSFLWGIGLGYLEEVDEGGLPAMIW